MAAGCGNGLGGIDDPRTLRPAALDRLAKRESHALVVAKVANRRKAGAKRFHAVQLCFEGLQRMVVADVGQQRLLAAAVGRQMDVAVDQAGKNRLVLEIDERRTRFRRRNMAIMDCDDPPLVDDNGRRAANSLPRNRDQPPGVDVSGRSICARSRQSSERRPRPKL